MRRTHLVAAIALTVTAFGVAAVGCFGSADDCERTLSCGSPTGPGATSSSSSGGGGGPGAECVPSQNEGPVAESCGVFVELGGDDEDDGSQSSPVKSLKHAIELAQDGEGRVYACGQVFPEAVVVPPGISIYGGLDCQSDWSYDAKKRTSIETPADIVPLTLMKGSGAIRLEDVNARAADAMAAGGSSVAVIADGAKADLVRCDFAAGAGAAGMKGTTPEENVGSPDNPDDLGIKGADGVNACMGAAAGNPGGVGKANTLCQDSKGGNGGAGGLAATNGSSGEDGIPSGDAAKGKGGAGDVGTGCEPGGYGQDGVAGSAGAGADKTALGTISVSGYTGAAGVAGGKGLPGQGGGGGGGGKGKAACNGASAGGGGAGGCGGNGGSGGLAGGASIAVISINATLTFTDVRLTAGNGGAGGDGGDGQIGGIGGSGGKGGILVAGTTKACAGGDGGSGGAGGQGGGGRGGHSLGVAYTGKAPPKASITIGMAGVGGVGLEPSGSGAAGDAANMIELPATM